MYRSIREKNLSAFESLRSISYSPPLTEKLIVCVAFAPSRSSVNTSLTFRTIS